MRDSTTMPSLKESVGRWQTRLINVEVATVSENK